MKTHKLKVTLNEIRRMQQLAGILKEEENPYDALFDDDDDDTSKPGNKNNEKNDFINYIYGDDAKSKITAFKNKNDELNDFVKGYVDLINDYIKKIEFVLDRIRQLLFGQNAKMKIEECQLVFVKPVEESATANFILLFIVKYSKLLKSRTFRISISSDKDKPLMVALESGKNKLYKTDDTEDIERILSTNIKGLNKKLLSFRAKNFKVTRGFTGKVLSDFDINTKMYKTKDRVPQLTYKHKTIN